LLKRTVAETSRVASAVPKSQKENLLLGIVASLGRAEDDFGLVGNPVMFRGSNADSNRRLLLDCRSCQFFRSDFRSSRAVIRPGDNLAKRGMVSDSDGKRNSRERKRS
jgi:hypothetical protein